MKHAAAATEASNAKQSLADKELLLVAAAPANGDMGEDAVHPSSHQNPAVCGSYTALSAPTATVPSVWANLC